MDRQAGTGDTVIVKSREVSKQAIKIFPIEDFFHLPPVSTTPVVHLEMRKGIGGTDYDNKNLKSEIS
jgi:hypothetical protein